MVQLNLRCLLTYMVLSCAAEACACPITEAVVGNQMGGVRLFVTHVAYEASYTCSQFDPTSAMDGPWFTIPATGSLNLPFDGQFEALRSVPGFQCQTPNTTSYYRGVTEEGLEIVAWHYIGSGSPGVDAGSAYLDEFVVRREGHQPIFWLPSHYVWDVNLDEELFNIDEINKLANSKRPNGPLGGGKITILGCRTP